MAYPVVCKACATESRVPQKRGLKLTNLACECGGALRRIGWQEMYRRSGRAPATAAEVAAKLLRETKNPAVGWGDARLLHDIAERMQLPHEGAATERKILDRIDRSHEGVLVKQYICYSGRGLARLRRYYLPECVPSTSAKIKDHL